MKCKFSDTCTYGVCDTEYCTEFEEHTIIDIEGAVAVYLKEKFPYHWNAGGYFVQYSRKAFKAGFRAALPDKLLMEKLEHLENGLVALIVEDCACKEPEDKCRACLRATEIEQMFARFSKAKGSA